MLKLLGNIIFAVAYLFGAIKYRLGVIVHIPDEYRR